jgi:hypothetical protein
MEGILNLLRKLGYSESEIKTVLEKVPMEPEGIMGTNVATVIFSKAKKGEKKLAKDFLISDTIGNPFEVNYYKGRSRDDILKSAEAQLKMINDELLRISYQIVNKNLKLTDDQLRNFSKNLETKRRFEKDFEAFKSRPEAEVLDITTKEKVGDVETLKEKAGLVAPPTTDLGKIDLRNKQIMQKLEDLIPSEETLRKEEAARKALLERKYEGKGFAGGVFGPSGIYRAVGRDFLLDQNAKGIIKLNPETVKSLTEGTYISGQPLMYADPVRIMRFHYGDDIFDKIPVDQIRKTIGAKSDILEAMSKVKAEPIKIEAPNTPGGYMTPNEIIANIEELEDVEKSIRKRESRFADMTNEEILNELGHYGSRRTAYEMALQFDHPEAYEQYIKSKPEKKAEGGPMGLDYLTGMEPPKGGYATGGRVNFEKGGGVPKMLKYLIDKLADEKDFNRKLLERASPKAVQDLYIEKYGALPSAQEIKEIVNKQLQGKYSMETVNPKTGEVTVPKEPVITAERKTIDYDAMEEANKLSLKHKEAAYAFDQIQPIDIYDKIAPDRVAEVMAEIKGKDYYNLTQKQQSELYKKAQNYLDEYIKIDRINIAVKKFNAGEEVRAMDKRYLSKFLPESGVTFESKIDKPIYKQGDIITSENFGNTPFFSQESLDNLEKARKMSSKMSLEEEMNMILNQYDKSMFVKNEQGMVDVTNPQNIEKMALLLKRDHPEIYNEIFNLGEDLSQKQQLLDFDVTGRKPNAVGGRVGFSNGTEDAPSITLDTHDKAPANMDKYPIKAGNLELGIIGAMRSGKSTPDPYVKINTADRDFTVRGKYNVPNTGISLLGDIGDIRSKSRVNIDDPRYNYKETIKDVIRLNPYSVGIEYAPDQNRNINLRYDNQGNVMLRGEARFAKGGLGYLVGE